MRKSTKLAILVAALVALCSLTALAKGWVWSEADAEWTYEDNYGERVFLEWKKSDGKFYFLGEDGLMLRDQIVEDGDNKFYVGADGAKIVNDWRQVPADDADEDLEVEYRWFFFGSTGKAVKSDGSALAKTTWQGNTYYFDADGKMLFGYHDGRNIINQDNPFDAAVVYYSGSNDDGAVKKNFWQKIDDVEDFGAYDETNSYWVYFDKNGKKATEESTKYEGVKWEGKRYYFDEFGRMKTKWASISTADEKRVYLNDEDQGWMSKKTWVYSKDDETNDGDDLFWYYVSASGEKMGADQVLKINGKFYAFNEKAQMLSGIVELEFPTGTNVSIASASVVKKMKDLDQVTIDKWIEEPGEYYFFSNDYVNDGSLKKSTSFEVEFFDDTYKLSTDKTGKLLTGASSGKYYVNGYLIAADPDYKYEVKKVYEDGAWVYKLVNATGVGVKKNSVVVDADGNYFVVTADAIYVAPWGLDYPSRVATAIKGGATSVKVGKTTYSWEYTEDAETGVKTVSNVKSVEE